MIRKLFPWLSSLWLRVLTFNTLAFFAGGIAVRCAQNHHPYYQGIAVALIPWVTFWSCFTTGLIGQKPEATANPKPPNRRKLQKPYAPTNVIYLPTRRDLKSRIDD